ncbi:MAG: energy-coupling factor ABC transporter permease [Marinifilaceae bacterium]
MHMADALVSPAVAAVMGAVSITLLGVGARKVRKSSNEHIAPLMGVMGAFIFACQMINFTIPGTGSSGHIVGGILLAAVLGPWAGFITLASVLVVQCLFFADGGILTLGCNIFNMGALVCLVAFPLIFAPIIRKGFSYSRIMWASVLACVIGLELGALSVTLETEASGITALPIGKFLLFMLPIHVAIGLVEGFATSAVIYFIYKYKPTLLVNYSESNEFDDGNITEKKTHGSYRRALWTIGVLALLIGGGVSWFASTHPDGLEWSLFNMTGKETPDLAESRAHDVAARIQDKLSFMPDYSFKSHEELVAENTDDVVEAETETEEWGTPNAGTTLAGIAGGGIIVVLAIIIGVISSQRRKRQGDNDNESISENV